VLFVSVLSQLSFLQEDVYMYMYNDQIKEDEIRKAYSRKGGEEERIQVISWKARRNETIRKTKSG
jgi:hypothetical protein